LLRKTLFFKDKGSTAKAKAAKFGLKALRPRPNITGTHAVK